MTTKKQTKADHEKQVENKKKPNTVNYQANMATENKEMLGLRTGFNTKDNQYSQNQDRNNRNNKNKNKKLNVEDEKNFPGLF